MLNCSVINSDNSTSTIIQESLWVVVFESAHIGITVAHEARVVLYDNRCIQRIGNVIDNNSAVIHLVESVVSLNKSAKRTMWDSTRRIINKRTPEDAVGDLCYRSSVAKQSVTPVVIYMNHAVEPASVNHRTAETVDKHSLLGVFCESVFDDDVFQP